MELSGKSTFTIETKQDKSAPAKKTVLTVVYDGCPESTAKALATQQLVVRLQSGWRTKGVPERIEVKMADYAPGMRHAGMTTEQAEVTLLEEAKKDPAKRAALLAKLRALELS